MQKRPVNNQILKDINDFLKEKKCSLELREQIIKRNRAKNDPDIEIIR